MKKWILAALAAVMILLCGCSGRMASVFSYTELQVGKNEAIAPELEKEEPQVTEEAPAPEQLSEDVSVLVTHEGAFDFRQYAFTGGDEVRMGMYTAERSGEYVVLDKLTLHGDGIARWYDKENEAWVEQPRGTGSYDANVVFFQTQTESAVVYKPLSYKDMENDMVRYERGIDGSISVSKLDDTYTVWLTSGKTRKFGHTDWLVLTSPKNDLIADWQMAEKQWKDYIIEGDNRWLYRGYYYLAPSNYIPSGKDFYHRIPSPYISVKMLDCTDRAASELSTAMLHVMLELLGDDGFFPTKAGSEWLQGEYEMGAGFFDTRFNTDLSDALLQASEQTGIAVFRSVACAYGEFFLEHARMHHQSVGEGWLVDDYAHPEGGKPTHCSLNHQLKEILYLYHMTDATGDNRFEQTADLMLLGIADVGMDWVKRNCDLWYAIDPEGQMIREDYPTLTYNDMYLLIQYLDENRPADKMYAERQLILRLMNKKLYYIISNAVEGSYYGMPGTEAVQ